MVHPESSLGPKAKSSETPKIESTLTLTLVPVADGGIYAVDEVYGVVWYVSNGKAVRIAALKADFINQLVPAVEGGAYVHVLTKDQSSALWYLKGETATKIQEGAMLLNSRRSLDQRKVGCGPCGRVNGCEDRRKKTRKENDSDVYRRQNCCCHHAIFGSREAPLRILYASQVCGVWHNDLWGVLRIN